MLYRDSQKSIGSDHEANSTLYNVGHVLAQNSPGILWGMP